MKKRFNKPHQKPLFHARIGNEVCHLATKLPPTDASVLSFRIAEMPDKGRDKHRYKPFLPSFEAFEAGFGCISLPHLHFSIAGVVVFVKVYSLVLLLLR